MADLADAEIGAEAVPIASDIERVLAGWDTVATDITIGMVLGHAESLAAWPPA